MQLDGKQTAMLARASALLPPVQRDDFQRSVRGVLGTLLHYPPTVAELRDTCRFILAARGISVGELLPPQAHSETKHDRSSNNFRNWRRKANATITA
jgi:hypothetical protein